MSLHVLIGTKGQLIKMAPILMELDRRGVPYNFIHTSQHKGICEDIARLFGLRDPDVYVVTKEKDLKNLPQMALWFVKVLMSGILNRRRIWKGGGGMVLLHGDTESTLLGLILAKFCRSSVVHIESGLRSYRFLEPFPEEIVRSVVSRHAEILFAPSQWAAENLRREGRKGTIYCTKGNTVFDSLRYVLSLQGDGVFPIPREAYAVASVHRKETLYSNHRLRIAVSSILRASKLLRVILVLHKKTEHALKKHRLLQTLEQNANIVVSHSFFDYFSFMKLVDNCEFVVTDGGGLQEETYFLNKPCLLLRNVTERQFGLGTTAYLSKFNNARVQYFLNNYRSFRRTESIDGISPALVIVDRIEELLADKISNAS